VSGKKRKPNHREILKFWELNVLNRNLGISEHGNAAFYFVDSVLRAYAVAETNANAPVDCEKAPPRHETGEKVSSVMKDKHDTALAEFVARIETRDKA
jgi:hypothetical protein